MKKLLLLLLPVFLSVSITGYGQLNFNAKRISADTVRGRTSNGLQLPYNWAGGLPGENRKDILINDTTLYEWIRNTSGGGGDFWKIGYNIGTDPADTTFLDSVDIIRPKHVLQIIGDNAAGGTQGISYNSALNSFFLYNGLGASIADGRSTISLSPAVGVLQYQKNYGAGIQTTSIEIDSTGIELVDQKNAKGAVYAADYSANFTDRSLPDYQHVWNNNADTTNLIGFTGIQAAQPAALTSAFNPSLVIGADISNANDKAYLYATYDQFLFQKGVGIIARSATDTTGIDFVAGQEGKLYGNLIKQFNVNQASVPLDALVTRDDVIPEYTGSVTDGAPTNAQITAIAGSPNDHDKCIFLLRDTDGTSQYYLISATGGTYRYLQFNTAP